MLWLQLPQHLGAQKIFENCVEPFLLENEKYIDKTLDRIRGVCCEVVEVVLSKMKQADVVGKELVGESSEQLKKQEP